MERRVEFARQDEFEFFDAQRHVLGCPIWADLWEAHWGRENLDSVTLANLQDMRDRPTTGCMTCNYKDA